MPWTAVYFLKRSTLASFSCSPPVSTESCPSSSVIAATIDWRVSGDRDEVIDVFLSDEVAAVDDQDVAVDVSRGPAGQEHGGAHQVGGLAPAGRGDVLDDAAVGVGIGPGRFGDRGLEVSRRDGVDLDVVGRQLVTVGLGEARDSGLGRRVGR